MKLNWFSPLPPARTDVAHYTARILPALASLAEIVLWTDQRIWDKSVEKYASVRRHPKEISWPELNLSDATFYNIGNNHLFHASIWQQSLRHPGIVILHDYRLQHLFENLYRLRHDYQGYLSQMKAYYGDEGLSAALEAEQSGLLGLDKLSENYPLTPLALENVFAAVVHTTEAFEGLKRANRWPVLYAPLPFISAPIVRGERAVKAPIREDAPYRMIVFGRSANNRRLDVLLKALADFPDRDRFHLHIYGQMGNARSLQDLIGSLNLKKNVMLHGLVTEEELERALDASHLAINLRYPTMGEASGSQMRVWSHGLPSLVTKVGWYATLPAEAVAHVRVEHEVEDIHTHLRAFLSDPEKFAAMGLEGRRILEEDHAPETYARSLLSFAAQAAEMRAEAAAFEMAERAAQEMSNWTDAGCLQEALDRVSEQIHALTIGRS